MASLRRRILGSIGVFLVLVVAGFAWALSHESACNAVPVPTVGMPTMKAVMGRCYGPPDILTVEDIEKPSVTEDRVLVKVHAASVNPVDWHYMRGTPYVMRMGSGYGAPKDPRTAPISPAPSRPSARASRSSSPATKYSAAATARSPNT